MRRGPCPVCVPHICPVCLYRLGNSADFAVTRMMLAAYDIAKSQRANIVKFITVGGAPHGGEWPVVLEETFEFFERYTKK